MFATLDLDQLAREGFGHDGEPVGEEGLDTHAYFGSVTLPNAEARLPQVGGRPASVTGPGNR